MSNNVNKQMMNTLMSELDQELWRTWVCSSGCWPRGSWRRRTRWRPLARAGASCGWRLLSAPPPRSPPAAASAASCGCSASQTAANHKHPLTSLTFDLERRTRLCGEHHLIFKLLRVASLVVHLQNHLLQPLLRTTHQFWGLLSLSEHKHRLILRIIEYHF